MVGRRGALEQSIQNPPALRRATSGIFRTVAHRPVQRRSAHCALYVVAHSGAASWRNQHRVQSARENSRTAAAAACRRAARFGLRPSTLTESYYSVRDVPLSAPESDSHPKHAEAGPAGMSQQWWHTGHATEARSVHCGWSCTGCLVVCWHAMGGERYERATHGAAHGSNRCSGLGVPLSERHDSVACAARLHWLQCRWHRLCPSL